MPAIVYELRLYAMVTGDHYRQHRTHAHTYNKQYV